MATQLDAVVASQKPSEAGPQARVETEPQQVVISADIFGGIPIDIYQWVFMKVEVKLVCLDNTSVDYVDSLRALLEQFGDRVSGVILPGKRFDLFGQQAIDY